MTTPHPVRAELLRVLSLTNKRDELDAWSAPCGQSPFWFVASNYLTTLRFDLASQVDGYEKTGESVAEFVEMLEARAGAQPEIHQIPDHRICVWLWRLKGGSKFVAFQRAESRALIESVETVPDEMLHYPDWWRQLRSSELRDGEYMFSVQDGGGSVCSWSLPSRPYVSDLPADTSDSYRSTTPCAEPGCAADSAVECGHKTFSEAMGTRFPEADDLRETRPRCAPCSDAQPGKVDVYHAQGECGDVTPGPVAEALEHPDGGPVHVAATEELQDSIDDGFTCGVCEGIDPESSDAPNSGHHWECPIGDKKLLAGQKAAEQAIADAAPTPKAVAPAIVHCSGAWVPPCSEPFACSPSPTTSRRVYKYPVTGDQPLRDQLPGVTCGTCRVVMEAVMKAGRWLGPNLDPTSNRGWFPAVDVEELAQGKENMANALDGPALELAQRHGLGAPPAPDECPNCQEPHYPEEDCQIECKHHVAAEPGKDECECPPECNCHPCMGELWDGTGLMPKAKCQACGHIGMEHDHRTKKCARCATCPGFVECVDRCRCGCARETHSRPNDECSRCACVAFRPGAAVEIESKSDRAAYIEKKRIDYVESLDMGKVTKQRTAKAYAQCQICKAMIKGPVKDEAGKITTQGDEWVGPKPAKKGRTISMNHRAHLSCADTAKLERASA